MLKRSTKEDVLNILEFHSKGFKNREIARKMNLSHRTIAYHVKKNGLIANGSRVYHLDKIDEDNARCSKCKQIHPLIDWPTAREGKKYPYRLSYCKFCKKKQYYDHVNKNIENYISDRLRKLKLRCKNRNIEFNITTDFIIDIYTQQEGLCFYTDTPMTYLSGAGRNRNALSIDRVECKLGYTMGNVVLCCLRFNIVKQDLTLEEMKNWMPPMYERIAMWRRRGIFVFDCNQTGVEF